MIYYIKTTPEVAKRLANLSLRNALKDGNIALWMSDLNSVPGDTLAERAAYVGGALLTPKACAEEYYGKTDEYAYCYTPEYFGGNKDDAEDNSKDDDASADGGNHDSNGNEQSQAAVSDSDYSASAFTPSVDGSIAASSAGENANEQDSAEVSENKK